MPTRIKRTAVDARRCPLTLPMFYGGNRDRLPATSTTDIPEREPSQETKKQTYWMRRRQRRKPCSNKEWQNRL